MAPREREIVQLIAMGKTSRQIGTHWGISAKTAETHRSNLMRKLGVHSISELVRYAVRNQIIDPIQLSTFLVKVQKSSRTTK
jgi:DNA-binding CsgD family transcriptional regulator